jgi:hypothetical protein
VQIAPDFRQLQPGFAIPWQTKKKTSFSQLLPAVHNGAIGLISSLLVQHIV